MKSLTVLVFALSVCAINGFHWNFFELLHGEVQAQRIAVQPAADQCAGIPDNTLLPVEANCQQFIRCFRDVSFTQTCPVGTPHFSPCRLTCEAGELEICMEVCEEATTEGPTEESTDPTDPNEEDTTAGPELPTAGTMTPTTTLFEIPTAPTAP